MRIAVVGSRDYADLERVARYVTALPPGSVVVSGGARGVDRAAALAARAAGLTVRVLDADWKRLGRGAGFARNEQIVAEAERVVAFWDGTSRGTVDTIRRARAGGKAVTVFGPSGEELDPAAVLGLAVDPPEEPRQGDLFA